MVDIIEEAAKLHETGYGLSRASGKIGEEKQDLRIAYHIDFNFNSFGLPKPLYLRIWYNCAGECIKLPEGGSWPLEWKVRAPITWAKHSGCFALLGHDFSEFSRHITDVRGLELLKQGCCPEAIANAMLGDEGMPD